MTTPEPKGTERRENQRFETATWGTVSLLDGTGAVSRHVSGFMPDVSRTGLQLMLEETLPIGLCVIVSFRGRKHINTRYAIVRRSGVRDCCPTVGFEFAECPPELEGLLASEHRLAQSGAMPEIDLPDAA